MQELSSDHWFRSLRMVQRSLKSIHSVSAPNLWSMLDDAPESRYIAASEEESPSSWRLS